MTLEEREDLAEAMIPHAAELVRLVGEDDADGIASLLHEVAPDRPAAVDALLIVLAAMATTEDDEAEPEPQGHPAKVLRAAHAKARKYREARIVIPEALADLDAEYQAWRYQVRQWKAAHGGARLDVA